MMQTNTSIDAELARILSMSDEEILAQPGAAEDATKTRAIVAKAVLNAAHDRGDWMAWEVGKAIVRDGCHYLADLDDGRTGVEVVAEVFAADEVGFYAADDENAEANLCPERLCWLGF